MIKNYRLVRESEGVVHYAGCVNDLCDIAVKSGIDYDTMKEIEHWADKHFELGDILEIRDIIVEVVDLEEKMDANEMLDLLAKLPAARLENIVSGMTENERQIVLKAVGAHKLMNDPTFYNAVKAAVASELWKRLNDDNLREEVEVCPHCDAEVTVMWDVEKQGYRATCPNCGEELMLCDACMHSNDNEGMDCDWSENGGCFRHRKEQK